MQRCGRGHDKKSCGKRCGKELAIGLTLMLFLSGCSTDQVDWHGPAQWAGLKDRHRLVRSSEWLLSNETRVYVAQPQDAGFGAELHQAFVTAIRRYYPHTHASQIPESLASARRSALAAGSNLVLYPTLRQRVESTGVRAVMAREASVMSLGQGQFDLDLGVFTAVDGRLIDQVQFESLAGLFSSDEVAVLWPPLDAYLREISDF